MAIRPMTASPYFEELSRFSHDLVQTPESEEARHRYKLYRTKRSMSPDEARKAAIAWETNMAEQRGRRKGHGTGAE